MACPGRYQAAQRILSNELARYGFDICHPFHPKWYNDSIQRDGLSTEVLPPLTITNSSCEAAYLVGNTKRLWPIFLDWLERQKKNRATDDDDIVNNDPLDTYTREKIGKTVEDNSWRFDNSLPTDDEDNVSKHKQSPKTRGSRNTGKSNHYDIFWAADMSNGRLVSMQRIASVSGLCYLDDATNMALHRQFGPWISFRAAIFFSPECSGDGGDEVAIPPPPGPVPKLLSLEEEDAAKKFVQKAFEASTPKDEIHKHLVASRDCVNLGREEYRFSESQLLYHYTQDKKYLRRNDDVG